MSGEVGVIFFSWARSAIQELRNAGMTETFIVGVVSDIRAAAIHEERLRVEAIRKHEQPPHFPTFSQMRERIKELAPPPALTAGQRQHQRED